MMEKTDGTKTLGQAIDAIIDALGSLDETSQATAIRAACDHLKIRPPDNLAVGKTSPGGIPSLSGTAVAPTDIRALKQLKQPSSANEMAALIAFYLSEVVPEAERKTAVEQEDMTKYFKQAGFPLPKAPQVLLTNAKNAGYFDAVGSGKYRLNAVGYNLVAHNLPRTQEKPVPKKKRSRWKSKPPKARPRAKQ
jgi:hypothetical protein